MSQLNKTTLQTNINSQLADNTSGNISAADVRDNLINITDSLLFNSGSQSIDGSLTVTGSINNLLISTGGGNVPSNISIGSTTNFSSSATGISNFAAGSGSLSINTTGAGNTAIGRRTLYQNTTGASNNALGTYALCSNTTGTNNTAIGICNLRYNTTGTNNTAIGRSALRDNTTGAYNTAIGYRTLFQNTTGCNNTAIGCFALTSNKSGSNNIAIGSAAGPSTLTQESNKLYIASGSGTPLIKGDFACKGVSINSFLNLLGSNPLPTSGEFSCNGTIAFSSSGNFFFRSASVWSKLNL